MTPKQRDRQRHRSRGGQYAQVNPCYRCGKSAGVDYCSGKHTDSVDSLGNVWHDHALCLCEPCAVYLNALSDADAWQDVISPAYGNHPSGRGAE